MAEYIECRECTSPSCKGCNTYILSQMLHHGKFNCLMNGNRTIHFADVAPVVHARWVGLEYDGYADGCPVYDLWECSNCGEEVSGEDVPDTHPWCHGCGARMDGE